MTEPQPARRPRRLAGLPQRLRLVFGVRGGTPSAEAPANSAEPVFADFVAFATDCRVFGALALPSGRMSDLLNAHDEYELVNVHLQSLADGHVVAMASVRLARDEIVAVHAAGPASARIHRTNMRAYPVVVRSEPYTIWGYLHALPGADPIASLRHRRPMIALTDAAIEYALAGRPGRFRLSTLIVNRELASSLEPTSDEDVLRP